VGDTADAFAFEEDDGAPDEEDADEEDFAHDGGGGDDYASHSSDPPAGGIQELPAREISAVELARLGNAGGVAATVLTPAPLASAAPCSENDTLHVTPNAVLALFGRDRASLLRVAGLPIQVERQKEFKTRSLQARQMRAMGMAVPPDFCPLSFFYTFQFDLEALRSQSPVVIFHLEQGLWTFGRWAVWLARDEAPSRRQGLGSGAAQAVSSLSRLGNASGGPGRGDWEPRTRPAIAASEAAAAVLTPPEADSDTAESSYAGRRALGPKTSRSPDAGSVRVSIEALRRTRNRTSTIGEETLTNGRRETNEWRDSD